MERKVYFGCLIGILFYMPCFGQAPQSFKYQSIARNSNGEPLTNTTLGIRINIRNLTETGAILYQETHSVSTNALGLFSISVGGGNVANGNFATIDWSSGAKFIDVEVDFTGGTSYSGMGASQLLSVPYALYAGNGKSGINGLNILNGNTNPSSSLGVDGEFYINTSTQTIFGPKASSVWPAGVSLVGPTGTAGINGINGLNVLNGTSDPTSGIGANGEFYINTSSNKIFGPKTSGAWPVGIPLVGSTGAPGTNGTNGINGLNVLNGTSDPTSGIGVNGEFYINTSTNKIFGPKASGTWPAGVSLVGPSGPSTNAWGLSGNSGTVDGTNFIGTTDNVPLNLKVNNQKAGRVSSTGSEVFLGYRAGEVNSGADNVGMGYQSMLTNSTGYRNTSTGSQSLASNTTGNSNSSFGYVSLNNNTSGYSNTAIGEASMYQNSTGFLNTAVGTTSLWMNASGAYNAAHGYFSLGQNSTGWYNSALGAWSLGSNTTGSNNTAIGFQAGYTSNSSNANTTGSNNTFIGYNSGPGTFTQLTNATAIGYNALVSANNSLVLGGTGADAVKVGIGVSVPVATLDVLGNIKIKDGTQGPGKVLTSDANGVATWTAPGSSSGWGLTGNAGTIDGTNFIGTIDNVPLNFKVNNQTAGRIDMNNVFLGINTGSNNIATGNVGVGGYSLFSNTTGISNTGTGFGALYSNTTGIRNVANGYAALYNNTTGQNNTAVGYNAINTASSGVNNTALGARALEITTSGYANTATGAETLSFNTTGSFNTACGVTSLFNNTTGQSNAALGAFAMMANTVGSTNTAMGSQSLYSNTSGSENTAVGFQSLYTNTDGYFNVAVGNKSLYSNTSGTANAAVGNSALNANTTGYNNTSLGYSTLSLNTSGKNNSANGAYSLLWNTTGDENTANGAYSLFNNSSGFRNTAFGYSALRANTNAGNSTAVGWYSLYSNTTGTSNSATGEESLFSNTTGSYNTAIGSQALYANTDGTVNVGVGFRTLYSNTSGYGNVAIGNIALNFNTTGNGNTATGWNSLYNNTTGDNNTATGRASLNSNTSGSSNVGIGNGAAFSSTTGSNNTAIGFESLYGNTIGDNNTAVGYRALTSIASNYTNSTAIGYNAQVTASNMIRLGDANVTSINGAVGFTVVSDKRFKKDISENVSGLPFIMKLRPVTYHLDMNEMARFLKTPNSLRIKESEERKEKVLQTGFIAQEVEKAANDLGYDFSGVDKPDGKDDFYGLRYSEFTVPLVKAVQEQQSMIDTLQKEILILKEQLLQTQRKQEELKSENTTLKETIEVRLKRLEEIGSVAAKK